MKDELTEDWTGNEVGVGAQPDFSINVQSCAEQHNKYICRTMYVIIVHNLIILIYKLNFG